MKNNLKDDVLAELTRLDLLSGRVPFTHHHDYVSINAAEFGKYLSRSDVAKLPASTDELYACAFLQTLEGLTTEQKIVSGIDKDLFNKCKEVASAHLFELETLLKIE